MADGVGTGEVYLGEQLNSQSTAARAQGVGWAGAMFATIIEQYVRAA
jgi:hypothetical protein